MAQSSGVGHNAAPSISGAGVAGQGVYNYGAAAAAGAGGAAGAAAASTIQERPKYVYGQPDDRQAALDDDASDQAHGVYSSQPHVQTSYNAETYGSYAAYDATGYQNATREYQGQQGYTDGAAAYQNNPAYDQHQQYPAYDQHQQYNQGYDNTQYQQYSDHGHNGAYQQQGAYASYDAGAYAVGSPTDLAAQQPSAVGVAAAAAAPTKAKGPVNHDDAYGGM